MNWMRYLSRTLLLIVLPSEWQREQMKIYGSGIDLLDASHSGITFYHLSLYLVVVSNSAGKGVPVFCAFMSKENEDFINFCYLCMNFDECEKF